MKLWQWLVALVLGRRRARSPASPVPPPPPPEPIVPAGTPERRAESVVLVLLGIAVVFGVGFIVIYAVLGLDAQLQAIALGGCLLFIASALTVVAKRLVVTEEVEDDYPTEHPEQQREIAELVHESGSRITRKRLLLAAGLTAGGTLGIASLTPVLSIGPFWYTKPLDRTPWRRGVRLVDDTGQAILAVDVEHQSFYTAFPEGADPALIGSPLVVLRLDPSKLELPAGREGWAPQGIVAYSKICTHAACAVALYRNPKFPREEPYPSLVCPCHYSTFNPFDGATVTFGPAGRPLPQLPLTIDRTGYLRAAGNFSGRVGPSWLNVRERPV